MTPVRLQTDRLTLRDFAPNDFAALADYLRSAGDDRPFAASARESGGADALLAAALAEQLHSPRAVYRLAVESKKSGVLIGICSLLLDASAPSVGWVEYGLAAVERRKGYASEAASALAAFAFQTDRVDRLRATCAPANVASARVLRRVGFWLEGRIRDHGLGPSGDRDSLLFVLRRRDWLARQPFAR
jgi:RimJ/RimL family protein N-acetyltransferase